MDRIEADLPSGARRHPGGHSRWRAKHAVFLVIGVMTVFVAWNNERFFLDPQAAEWAHYSAFRWQLLPHGLGGTLALTLGALQFSTRFRQRYLRLHRLAGRIYIGAACVTAPVAIWIAFIASPWFLIPFTVLQATTWVLFTLVAYRCIRRRDIRAHREWMMRSYAVVLIFLEGRVLMAIPAIGRQGMDAVVLVNWGCFAVTLIVMEVVLRWREIVPLRRVHATAGPVAGTAP